MPNNIGSLSVDVTTNTASLETGMARVADIISQRSREMQQSVDNVNSRLNAFADTFKALTGIASVGIGAHLFVGFIESAIDAQAHLQDLADKVGTTASGLSSLIPAAKLSGTSLDEVAAASGKFSKALVEIQSGTGKSAAAFKALGFNASDAARFLKDPTQGLFELSKRSAEFATDGNKTAAMMLLLGKNAQQLAPFMKQLAEQTELTTRVTDAQAQAAKKLQDEYATLQLRTDDLKNSIAAGIVPQLSVILKAFTDASAGPDSFGAKIKAMAEDGTFAVWVNNAAIALAVLAESFIAVLRVAGAFKSSVDVVIADLKVLTTAINAPENKITGALGFTPEEAAAANAAFHAAVEERIATLADGNKTLSGLWNDNFTALSDSLKKSGIALEQYRATFAASMAAINNLAANADTRDRQFFGAAAQTQVKKPSIDTAGFANGAKIADEFTKALQALQKQADIAELSIGTIFSGEVLTDAQKFLAALKTSDAWKTFTAGQKAAIENSVKLASELQRQQALMQAAADAGKEFGKQLSSMAEGFGKQQAQLSAELEQLQLYGQATKQQTAATLEFELSQGQLGKALNVLAVTFPQVADAIRDYLRQQAASVDATRNAVEQEKDFIAAQKDAIRSYGDATKALQDQLQGLKDQNFELLNGTEALNARKIAELQYQLALTEVVLSTKAATQADVARSAQLREQIAILGQLGQQQAINKQLQQAQQDVRDLDNFARDAFVNIEQHGTDAFKNIGQSIDKYVLEALYKLIAQPFIIQVGASLTGLSTQAVAQALGVSGGGGNLLNIGSGFSGGGIFSSGLGNQFATSSVGQSLGLSQTTQLVDSIGGLDTAFTGTTTTLTGFGAALGTAIPIIGTVIAGLSLFSSLFGDKTPSPTRGQFQVTPTSTPASAFEDQRFTASDFGNLGFADAATQYFSGEAAQAFNQIVANALDAFSTRYSPEQSQRLAGILQSTTFASSTGGSQSTEDFIKQYGGQILRQVVTDAFDVLDAGLANVVRAFQGTDDEFSKFSNTLLGIYDATKDFDSQFRGTIISALEGASQAAADKILAFVGFVSQFGDSIQGLGAQFESVDASNITAFVDALGGAQTAVASFAFLGQNFTTTADRVNQAQKTLNDGFTALGIALPASHQAFLDLLSSLDLNTDAGRQTYASLVALAPAFVAVAGSADQAAEALRRQVESAQQFFDQNFYSDIERQAQAVADALATIGAVNADLGVSIPTTVAGFRALLESVKSLYGADSELYQQLIVLAPAIITVANATGEFSDAASQAADAISNAAGQIIVSVGSLTQQGGGIASAFLQSISGLVSAIDDTSTQYAVKIQLISAEIDKLKSSNLDSQVLAGALGPLNQALNQAAGDLAQFTVLSAQYGDGIAKQLVALQDWYDEQNQILTGGQSSADITQRLAGLQAQLANAVQYGYDQVTVNFIKGQISALQGTADLIGALDTVFRSKWDAIISGGSAAAESLDDFIKKIQQLADATQGNAGQQAGIELALSSAKISSLQTQYAKLDPTSALAKAIAADISKLQIYNAGLATQIAHFTIYTAQYNAATANQLVELENWYADQQEALAGNNDALAILGDIFQDKWQAIIDGISAGVDELSKLKVDIAEYLKRLVISDISPLTPSQKLETARTSLEAEIALAQQGDVKALGDVTQYLDAFLALDRDFNKSNDQFAADFNLFTQQLADIAGVQPSGQPLDSSAAIASVLPTSGTLASSDDMKAVRDLLERLIPDLADANTADSIAERQAIQEAADEIAAVVGGSQLK